MPTAMVTFHQPICAIGVGEQREEGRAWGVPIVRVEARARPFIDDGLCDQHSWSPGRRRRSTSAGAGTSTRAGAGGQRDPCRPPAPGYAEG